MFAPQMPQKTWMHTLLYANSFMMFLTGWTFFLMQRPMDGVGYIQFSIVNLFGLVMYDIHEWERLQEKQRLSPLEDDDFSDEEMEEESSAETSPMEAPAPVEEEHTEAPAPIESLAPVEAPAPVTAQEDWIVEEQLPAPEEQQPSALEH